MKNYICLMENGDVRLLRRKPDDNQSSHMHGWCELKSTTKNAIALARAGLYCAYGADRDE